MTFLPRLHLAPAREFDPRDESDSPFSPNVNANHQPREAGLTRLFCPSKKVGFDPRAGSDTAIFYSVNRKPSLPRRLIANFRWRSRNYAHSPIHSIFYGGLWVIDGSDTRGESAPRAGAVCKRGGKNPRAESDSRGESDPRAGAKCKRGICTSPCGI